MAKVFADALPRFLAEWDRKQSRKKIASGAEPAEKITYTARLILVLGGNAVFRSGSALFPTRPGTLLYLPPACVYSAKFRTDRFFSSNIFFSFSDAWLEAAELKSIMLKNVPFWGKRESNVFSTTLVSSIGKGQDGVRVRIAKGPSAHGDDTVQVTLTSGPSDPGWDCAEGEPDSCDSVAVGPASGPAPSARCPPPRGTAAPASPPRSPSAPTRI